VRFGSSNRAAQFLPISKYVSNWSIMSLIMFSLFPRDERHSTDPSIPRANLIAGFLHPLEWQLASLHHAFLRFTQHRTSCYPGGAVVG